MRIRNSWDADMGLAGKRPLIAGREASARNGCYSGWRDLLGCILRARHTNKVAAQALDGWRWRWRSFEDLVRRLPGVFRPAHDAATDFLDLISCGAAL
ncbi:hypothetical protein FH972_025478 [Carpinus fangiana]|uniref:Uncharacterized protein n=1 Tax=Carpinus fangiana TaxID=176857 RepID=A0A5N6L1E0_9ROSI|nr:hypothetical protein FH972_025478 [Carpinus fangiana]